MEAYARYARALVRKAERMLQSRDDAMDLVQALFADLLAKGLTEPDLPYLYRATTRRALNLLRDRGNRARLLERQESALRGPARVRCEQVVIGLDMLARLVERLDDDLLELLVYRFVDDLTQEEIAALSGLSRKTVGKRLARLTDIIREQGNVSGGVQ